MMLKTSLLLEYNKFFALTNPILPYILTFTNRERGDGYPFYVKITPKYNYTKFKLLYILTNFYII